nr:dienelactone hydrolase family protein [Micromonospora sp. DSM 115978]
APDHVGDTLDDFAAGQEASLVALASDRTLDLSAVVDAMTAPASVLADMVDEDRVGVVGFSFGGMSALASASGFLSAPADPRVDAVVAIAPASEPMPADLLATVDVPVLLFGGTMDGASPVARNAVPAFEHLRAAEPRYLVVVDRAAHNSFTDLCDQAYLASDEGMSAGARVRIEVGAASTCLPPTAAAADVQLVTSTYVVAFLAAQLRGDASASALFYADRPPPWARATVRSAP